MGAEGVDGAGGVDAAPGGGVAGTGGVDGAVRGARGRVGVVGAGDAAAVGGAVDTAGGRAGLSDGVSALPAWGDCAVPRGLSVRSGGGARACASCAPLAARSDTCRAEGRRALGAAGARRAPVLAADPDTVRSLWYGTYASGCDAWCAGAPAGSRASASPPMVHRWR